MPRLFLAPLLFALGCGGADLPGPNSVFKVTFSVPTDGKATAAMPAHSLYCKGPPRMDGDALVWLDLVTGKEEHRPGWKLVKAEAAKRPAWVIADEVSVRWISSVEPKMDGDRIHFTDAFSGERVAETVPGKLTWREVR